MTPATKIDPLPVRTNDEAVAAAVLSDPDLAALFPGGRADVFAELSGPGSGYHLRRSALGPVGPLNGDTQPVNTVRLPVPSSLRDAA